MESKKLEDQKVEVNFESHPPIDADLDAIGALLRQTLLQFNGCHELAKHLIDLKQTTQVIALEEPEEENASDDEEPDNNIYGVSSVIQLPINSKPSNETPELEACKHLLKFIEEKCPKIRDISNSKDNEYKLGMIVNERYINLPPQLALPTLKDLTRSLDAAKYTHLVFVTKILLSSRDTTTKLASKKSKNYQGKGDTESIQPIVFVNPEEEIMSEGADYYVDFDVSSQCDENATWSFNSDIKYIPHRRIIVIDYKNWHKILDNLEKELR